MKKNSVDFSKISKHEGAEDSPGFLLWRASTLWRREIESALKPHNLTHPQFVILATTAWLTRNGEKVSQAAVGKQAGLDPNTTSQILRSLLTKKLIKKEQLTDERTKHPLLTEKGSQTLKKALPAVENVDSDFFSKAGVKKKDLLQCLQKLAGLQ
jgi:MarR family transcriptional regulator, organic hydroperoxide resistance regulator